MQVSKESIRVMQFLAGTPVGTTTVNETQLHEIMMQTGGNMLACGSLYNIEAKLLGAGVYKLSLSRTN